MKNQPATYQETLNRYDACNQFEKEFYAQHIRPPAPEDYFVAGSLWESARRNNEGS